MAQLKKENDAKLEAKRKRKEAEEAARREAKLKRTEATRAMVYTCNPFALCGPKGLISLAES